MIEDRKAVAAGYLAEGTRLASDIRIKADQDKAVLLAKAGKPRRV